MNERIKKSIRKMTVGVTGVTLASLIGSGMVFGVVTMNVNAEDVTIKSVVLDKKEARPGDIITSTIEVEGTTAKYLYSYDEAVVLEYRKNGSDNWENCLDPEHEYTILIKQDNGLYYSDFMIDNGWKNGYYRYMEEAEFTVTGSSQKYTYDGSAQLKYVSLDKKYIKAGDELTITAKIDPGTADVKYIDAHIQGGRGGGGLEPINYSLGDDSSTVRLLSVGNNTFEKTIRVPDYWNDYDGLYSISMYTLDGSERVEVGFHNDNDFETGIVVFGHIEGAYSLEKDENLQLDSNFWTDTPDDYQWKSSDESIAKVDEHGVVKAVGEGKCYIDYVHKDFDFNTDTAWSVYEIEVTPSINIQLDKKLLVLDKGKSGKLTATVKPDNAADKSVAWTSSNTNVATVDNTGNVTAVNHGTAKITAKTSNGKTAECEVRVNFADVASTSQYYYKPVYWAAENKITTGSNGLFAPHSSCTREHAITFLWRMAGSPQPKSMVSKFKDVQNKNSYSYKAIMWGTEKGIITGSGGVFAPNSTCTREQIVTMLWRLAGKPAPKSTSSKFKNVQNKNSYSYNAILWASEKGITTGANGEFKPGKTCTRAEIVTFIYRYKNTAK